MALPKGEQIEYLLGGYRAPRRKPGTVQMAVFVNEIRRVLANQGCVLPHDADGSPESLRLLAGWLMSHGITPLTNNASSPAMRAVEDMVQGRRESR